MSSPYAPDEFPTRTHPTFAHDCVKATTKLTAAWEAKFTREKESNELALKTSATLQART